MYKAACPRVAQDQLGVLFRIAKQASVLLQADKIDELEQLYRSLPANVKGSTTRGGGSRVFDVKRFFKGFIRCFGRGTVSPTPPPLPSPPPPPAPSPPPPPPPPPAATTVKKVHKFLSPAIKDIKMRSASVHVRSPMRSPRQGSNSKTINYDFIRRKIKQWAAGSTNVEKQVLNLLVDAPTKDSKKWSELYNYIIALLIEKHKLDKTDLLVLSQILSYTFYEFLSKEDDEAPMIDGATFVEDGPKSYSGYDEYYEGDFNVEIDGWVHSNPSMSLSKHMYAYYTAGYAEGLTAWNDRLMRHTQPSRAVIKNSIYDMYDRYLFGAQNSATIHKLLKTLVDTRKYEKYQLYSHMIKVLDKNMVDTELYNKHNIPIPEMIHKPAQLPPPLKRLRKKGVSAA